MGRLCGGSRYSWQIQFFCTDWKYANRAGAAPFLLKKITHKPIGRENEMGKTRNYITWGLTALLALAYLGSGFAMVSGVEKIVQEFALFGLPAWFRITIGSLEILGGILLLLPAFTGAASFGLSILMIGGFACHVMFTSPIQALPPLAFFAILTYIYLTRKNVVPRFLQKRLIH
jgi:uncharacterized membrane protein YphA (DoxX/SURF4 family)